jgi:hypothetical protein
VPPHQGHDHGPGGAWDDDPDDDHGPPRIEGLPVRHSVVRPGAVSTGCGIAAVFAVLAHLRSVGAGLVWDDRIFLLEDARLRSLSNVWTAFARPFFPPEYANEMYRPLVNASMAVDWFLTGSTATAPVAWWFHAVNVLLHAANAALVYLLLTNLTKRRLGAPLIAACLFAIHPLAVEPVSWIVGRCDLLATLFGLLSAVVLLRSPGKPRMAWTAAALWGAGLFAKAGAATLPLVVALGLVAYHEVEPRRFLTWRLAKPFLCFALPAAVWAAATTAVLGAPSPVAGGRLWHDVSLGDALQGVGRATWIHTANVFLPVRLSGDYSGDVAFHPQSAPWDATSVLGLAILAGAAGFGSRLLRRHAAGFPLLAWVVALVPVLQIVPIGAVAADRFVYLPMAFLLLLVAEGLEHLYYRWGAARGLAVSLALFAILPVMCHQRARVWADEVTFFRDAAARYPAGEDTRVRLALALSRTGRAEDRAEAKELLRRASGAVERPDDELALLGALLLEDGEYESAEAVLRRAVDAAGGKPMLGAKTRYNLAVCLKRLGRPDEAVPLLDEALRRAPGLEAARSLRESLR